LFEKLSVPELNFAGFLGFVLFGEILGILSNCNQFPMIWFQLVLGEAIVAVVINNVNKYFVFRGVNSQQTDKCC